MPLITLGILILFLIFFWSFRIPAPPKSIKHHSLRIHVNGTRGKSSVTRLIAAGLLEVDVEHLPKLLVPHQE